MQRRGTLPSVNMLTEAVLHGAGLRVRPVMMTTATIIFGLLPVLYGSGTGRSHESDCRADGGRNG